MTNNKEPKSKIIRVRRIKLILIFLLVIIFNLSVSILLFGGARALTSKALGRSKEVAELIKETSRQLARTLYNFYLDKTQAGNQREEDPVILARQNLFDVYTYDLSLSFDIPDKTINGELIMTANSMSDTLNLIYLNFYQNMNVSEVKFSSKKSTETALEHQGLSFDFETPEDITFKRENDYIIINLNRDLKKGEEFALKITYSGKPKNVGFDSFSFKELYGNPVVYNLSEPNYGPAWWPSKDLPDDKALTTMELRVPTGLKGVSNGLLVDSVQNGDGTTMFTWKSTYPIATYLVSIVVSKFSYWEETYKSIDGSKEMPVVYYVFPKDSAHARTDWGKTTEMIRFFSRTFGEYPFINEKYGMVEFGWVQGAMENQTITAMGYLLVNGNETFETVIAHELAHQWFGDAVTLKDWKNIWLNEGFATYSEALWEEHTKGKDAYLSYMKNCDYGYFHGTVYAPEGYIFSPSVYPTIYQKAGWVLHMMRGVLGDDTFFKAVREYYERFKYKNAETQDLQAVFEEMSGQNLQWFFDQWVYEGTGRPKYEYSWKFENFQDQPGTGAYSVRLNIKQVQIDRDVYKMPIKITVVTSAGEKEYTVFNDAREQSFLLSVDSNPRELFLDKDGWILKKIAKAKY
jgi:aminopeptidase N